MLRLQKFVGCLLVIMISTLFSCCTPLEKWVRERGFKYDKNYSTINKLGYKVIKGVPKPNPSWKFNSEIGFIPDLEEEKNRTIEIKTSGELSKLMKHITDANLSAELKLARRCTIIFQGPFTEEIVTLMPTYTGLEGETQKLKIVDRVLNCGKMEMKIYNKNNSNISAKFDVKETGDIAGSLNYDEDSNSITSGKNYYVGYAFSNMELTIGRKHSFKIDSEQNYNEELGLLTQLRAVREKAGAPHVYECLVALALHPMGSTERPLLATKSLRKTLSLHEAETTQRENAIDKMVKVGPESGQIVIEGKNVDLWELAEKVESIGEENIIEQITGEPKLYRVEMGSSFIVIPSDKVSILLVVKEIKRLKEEEKEKLDNYNVNVDGQMNTLNTVQ